MNHDEQIQNYESEFLSMRNKTFTVVTERLRYPKREGKKTSNHSYNCPTDYGQTRTNPQLHVYNYQQGCRPKKELRLSEQHACRNHFVRIHPVYNKSY
uniref:Uncharacterized protein n=1 Tax=Arundo donax TaxID=35708 RepID=A0A0A8XN30_ARUDO